MPLFGWSWGAQQTSKLHNDGETTEAFPAFSDEQPSSTAHAASSGAQVVPITGEIPPNPFAPLDHNSEPAPRRHDLTRRVLRLHNDRGHGDVEENIPQSNPQSTSRGRSNTHKHAADKKSNGNASGSKPRTGPILVERSHKLGTFAGVFVPTFLNLLSILMFLRFGFILGQAGVLGMMGMLIAAFMIDLVTIFSLSAIASNGTVRGGGAYYLISRSLGPEFGGSIGVVFYMGLVFNTGLNAVGLIDCITQNFGSKSGSWLKVLPEGMWWNYLWATIVLTICTGICLAGSAFFSRASKALLVILLVSTLSIPLSALVVPPFESRRLGIVYTGLSAQTLKGNLLPNLTKGAAGSRIKGKETFQDIFGVLFPATSGIFAGASMSGDLKHPSKAIPKGTLYGLALTFLLYTLVILSMAATITRSSLLLDVNVIQDTNMSEIVVLLGEFATTFFSTLMGVIGSAKLCQALARDKLLPGFSVFGQGSKKGDEPTYAIILTYIVAQVTMLADINEIASFVTMTYLMTFLVMNLATFLLKIGSAPNFRPSFHFFTWQTALAGTIVSGTAMFFVDGVFASGCVAILIIIFLLIHYTTPPKSWGDVSQNLIYHQVRKYLLRLRQEHVKFWRPQILLFVNDPRRQYKLIQFCNHMKKGALYILGHVIVSSDFGGSVPEARRQQAAWTKYIDFSKVKAFVNIAIAPGLDWGARNIVLTAGLGGMRPNIAVLGFYNMEELRRSVPLIDITQEDDYNTAKPSDKTPQRATPVRLNSNDRKADGQLPTDLCRTESMISPTTYVTILEDLLLRLQINVALARGFQGLEFPNKKSSDNTKKYIDLWPIQMSAEIASEDNRRNHVLTTNFDTYTLILQLGCILNTVPAWKKAYTLRVVVFVEYESDVEEERGRVKSLLENLRIQAEVLVFWLASGELTTYEIIINGQSPGEEAEKEVDECLKNQDWWQEIQTIRGKRGEVSASQDLADVADVLANPTVWPEASFQQGPRNERVQRFLGLRRLLKKSKRRHTMSSVTRLGVSLGLTTQRLAPELIRDHPSHGSASEDSGLSDDDELQSEDEDGSAASEGDIEIESSETDTPLVSPAKLTRRKSHGDAIRGPRPSKRATGEKEPKVPEPVSRPGSRRSSAVPTSAGASSSDGASIRPASISNLTNSIGSLEERRDEPFKRPVTPQKAASLSVESNRPVTPQKAASISVERPTPERLEERFSALRASTLSPRKVSTPPQSPAVRPTFSRHASMPKFTSKPVPVTRVATEEGPGPSIMFTDTPSPPIRDRRLPSAYSHESGSKKTTADVPDHISETSEHDQELPPPLLRTGSGYSTQSVPLSFNDLPCRAQHLILNQLIRQHSADTAVMFTTLPSPIEGTCKSEEASLAYLSDLEVLVAGCPPCLLIHSNSMTVTMSL